MSPFIRSVRLWPQSHESEERRATWLELFFDVGFVAAIAQLSTSLAHDYSTAALLRFALLLFVVWWAWLGQTLYTTRFDAEDGLQRIFILLQLFAVAAMAANAKGGLESRDSAGFGAAYGAMRLVLVVQYLRARRLRESCSVAGMYACGFGVAAAFWIIGALLPIPFRFAVWAFALAVDVVTPSIVARMGHRFSPDPKHLPERMGLFTLILLGEFVASVMRGMERQESWPPLAVGAAFLSLGLAVAIWSAYFDVVRAAEERPVETAVELRGFWIWCNTHFGLSFAIVVVGVGLEHAVSEIPGGSLHGEQLAIFAVALALLAVMLATLGFSRYRRGKPASLALRAPTESGA